MLAKCIMPLVLKVTNVTLNWPIQDQQQQQKNTICMDNCIGTALNKLGVNEPTSIPPADAAGINLVCY